jgi:antirestriction protein ArdC
LYDRAADLGVTVRYAAGNIGARGYYSPGREEIVLLSHDERTFFHELAHAAHQRVLEARGDKLQGGQNAKQEVVAEVTAAVLSKLYDFEGFLPHSREYVEHYAGKDGPARAALKVLADVQAVLLLIIEGTMPVAAAA